MKIVLREHVENLGRRGEVVTVAPGYARNYLLPRNCPRVTFYALPDSDPADAERLLGPGAPPAVVAIEAAWFARARSVTLYRYRLPPEGFRGRRDGDPVPNRGSTVLSTVPPCCQGRSCLRTRIGPHTRLLPVRFLSSPGLTTTSGAPNTEERRGAMRLKRRNRNRRRSPRWVVELTADRAVQMDDARRAANLNRR